MQRESRAMTSVAPLQWWLRGSVLGWVTFQGACWEQYLSWLAALRQHCPQQPLSKSPELCISPHPHNLLVPVLLHEKHSLAPSISPCSHFHFLFSFSLQALWMSTHFNPGFQNPTWEIFLSISLSSNHPDALACCSITQVSILKIQKQKDPQKLGK